MHMFAMRRITAATFAVLLLAPALVSVVPTASSAAQPSGMRWGMNVPAIDPMAEVGAKPDFAMYWVGVWNRDNWGPVENALRTMRDKGVTPVIQWYYWGDDISPECVENGCYSSLHGNTKTKADWYAMADRLAATIAREMGGREVIVIVETEFNKGGVPHHTYAPTFDAYLEDHHKKLKAVSGVSTIVGFGGWSDNHWSRFPKAVASSDYVGFQALRSSVRSTLDQYLGVVNHLVDLAGRTNGYFPGKALFITDLAFSSYPEPEYAEHQRQVVAELWARVGELQARNVKGLMYRSLIDVNMDTANYHGEAERWWGLRHRDGSDKPSMKAWLDGVGAVPPPPPPPKSVPAKLEAEAMTATAGGRQSDSKASGGAAWNLWSNGHLREYVGAADAGTYDVTVRARGSSADGGWPLMIVSFDGKELGRANVASSSYADYRFRVELPAGGSRELRLAYTNDHRTATEDRNLVVDYADVTLVALANRAPAAAFTATTSGLSASFDGRGSTDPDGDALTYAWSFGDGATGTGATATRTYARGGTYTVTLTVSDGRLSSSTTRQVTVDAPPSAAFAWTSSGLTASFDASASTDPEGQPLSYAWTFGDGSTATGRTATRTYAAGGEYQVRLTVTDAAGQSATATRAVRVDAPPVAEFAHTASGLTASFDASASRDPEGGALAYAWDFGDGSTGAGVTASRTYAAEGTYTVRLTVTDPEGASASATKSVGVVRPNTAPTPAFRWFPTGLSVALDASGTRDAEGDAVSYRWDFGDGTSGTGVSPSKTYASSGTYRVTLTATDDRGASASLTQDVTVNRPPVASFATTVRSLAASFDASASSDADGDSLTYAWDFGDGSTATGVTASRTYAAPGSYTVRLTVSDGRATATTSQVVTAKAPYFPASLEAEAFQTKTVGARYSDAGASGGAGWNVWGNGAIRHALTVESTGAYVLTVTARGDPALGVYPTMEVRLDGVAVATFTVSPTYGRYAVPLDLTADETRTLAVAFTNDHYDPAKNEDRNLLVDVVTLAPAPPPALREVESFATKTAGGRTSDASASGGAWWNLWSNGHVGDAFTVDAAGTYRVSVVAKGAPLSGVFPEMTLEVDGRTVGRWHVTSAWTAYEVALPLAAGAHDVKVHYTNDARTTKEDRNLHLDVVRVRLG